jgi:uncharacterized membrane protein YfcA
MNTQIALQWLPGIVIVAFVAFFPLFFIRQNFAIRLFAACIAVAAFLFMFGLVLGHQFSFTRSEDVPPLLMGLALGCLLAVGARSLRIKVAGRRKS